MKLTRRMAITFIAVPFISAVIYFTAAISLGSSIRYKVIRVYYAQLRLLADNSSLYKLNMQSQYERTGVLTLDNILLSPLAQDVNGNILSLPAGLTEAEKTGPSFPKGKIFSNYEVSKPQIDSLLQFTGVAYFKLEAVDYPTNYIAYKITAYNSSDVKIPLPDRKLYLDLNPCPPARAYQP